MSNNQLFRLMFRYNCFNTKNYHKDQSAQQITVNASNSQMLNNFIPTCYL